MTATLHRADAHRLLVRALRTLAGADTTVAASHGEAWASATFRGARHAITLRLAGADATARRTRLAEALDGIEFDLPGHLVADIGVRAQSSDGEGETIEIEALTVEDA